MRWLLAGLVLVLLALQYRLWIAQGSLAERHRLEQQIQEQTLINAQLQERNSALAREVLDLKSGNKGLEQRAREQLGLIRQGETFYQFADRPVTDPVSDAQIPAAAAPPAESAAESAAADQPH